MNSQVLNGTAITDTSLVDLCAFMNAASISNIPILLSAQSAGALVKAMTTSAPVQPMAMADDWKWMPIKATGTMADAGAFSGLPVGAAEPWIAKQVWEAMAAQSPAAPAAQGDAKDAINAELVAALKDITDDICERFDMESSSTNSGIKNCVERARAAIAAKAAS